MCRWISIAMISVVAVSSFVSCSKEKAKDSIVVDRLETLTDGQFLALKLGPGMYRLEMTASGDGASVEWIGATCPPSGELKVYNALCEFKQDGQLIVKNPTVWGTGGTTTVTIKVTSIV